MPGKKMSGGGGIGGGMSGSLKGIMAGSVSIFIALIMITLAMTTIADMLDDNNITWSDYPGAEDLWGMVPMMMGVGLVLFGVLLAWIGQRGGTIHMKTAISAPLSAIVMVLLAPIVVSFLDGIVNHTSASDFLGLDIFTIIPMLYAIAVISLPGILGYIGAGGKKPW